MDRITESEDELELLRELCDETIAHAHRAQMMQVARSYVFKDPEHKFIFESISILFPRGPISQERLTVHLNNRGFPDVDVGKYFPTGSDDSARKETA